MEWLIRLVNAGESQLVIRKLCTSLIAYYLRPAGRWEQCVRHLVLSFNEGRVIPSNTLTQAPKTGPAAADLSVPCLMATLWLAGGLAEEVGKASAISIQTYHVLLIVKLIDTDRALVGTSTTRGLHRILKM